MKHLIIGAVLLAAVGLLQTGCGDSPRDKEIKEEHAQKEAEAKQAAYRDQLLADLKKTYNGDDSWNKGSIVWTAELQDRLIPADGRPIMGVAHLYDVERKGQEYFVYLAQWKYDQLDFPGVEFALKCSRPERQGDVPPPLSNFDQTVLFSPEYVFVAKIYSVRKSYTAAAEKGASEDTLRITTSPHYIASGDCRALKYIEPPPSTKSSTSGSFRPRKIPGEK